MALFQNLPTTDVRRARLQKLINQGSQISAGRPLNASSQPEVIVSKPTLIASETPSLASEIQKPSEVKKPVEIPKAVEAIEVKPPQASIIKKEEQKAASVIEEKETTLPLTAEEIKQGLSGEIKRAICWLAVWCERQIKKLTTEKFKGKEKTSLEMQFLEVQLPRDNEIEIAAAEGIFAAISSLYKGGFLPILPFGESKQPTFSFEIVAEFEKLRFIVGAPKEYAQFLEKQIHGSYPPAQIEPLSEYNPYSKEGFVSYAELILSGKPYYPLRSYPEFKESGDPLSSLTSAMTKLEQGEAAIFQLLVSPTDEGWRKRGSRWVQTAQTPSPEGKVQIKIDQKLIEGVQKKISKVGLKTVVRVAALAKDEFSASTHLTNISGTFEQFHYSGLGRLAKHKIWRGQNFLVGFLYRYQPELFHQTVLNIEELATLYHFPNKNVQTPNIAWLSFKKSSPPQSVPEEGLYLGYSRYRGITKKIYLLRDDRRRHLYVLGQTGTGKSEFLKHLAIQDIRNGEGMAFIDPHGQAVEDILQMVPAERADDVIYFNPGDFERPMGLNILEAKTEEGKHLTINSFIALLYKLYDPNRTGIMGPRLERAIRNVMLTAMSEEGSTMIEVYRLLISPEFAKEKLSLVSDPLVKKYWTEELAQTSDFHKSETLGYFVSKFDRFVTEKIMRNIIGQGKSAFDFREVMDQKKILLVNLSKGLIGEENSNFLGLILVPRLLAAAMSRVDLPEEQRSDFYLYVDEFQNFATPDFVQILSEARKYRLSLTVGNQFIGQLDEKIKDAVFGNVGSLFCFRIGQDDAEYLEHRFDPIFNKSDLINLPVGNLYARVLVKNHPSPPFSMQSDWEEIKRLPRDPKMAETLKELSRLKYGRDKILVEQEIKVRAKLE